MPARVILNLQVSVICHAKTQKPSSNAGHVALVLFERLRRDTGEDSKLAVIAQDTTSTRGLGIRPIIDGLKVTQYFLHILRP